MLAGVNIHGKRQHRTTGGRVRSGDGAPLVDHASVEADTPEELVVTNAAHELKTVITILGSADFLLTEGGDDPKIRRRLLNHILAEALRMHRSSETLLKLARTAADLGEPEVQPVAMSFLVEVAERAEPLLEEARLRLAAEDRGGRVLANLGGSSRPS